MAMHNYQDTHGRMPPAVVYGANDQPMHSWRVLILPYLEQHNLYQQFHLDEPWDSPHNLELLPKMPALYTPPSGKRKKVPPYHTVCHVFVGKGAAFEGREGLHLGKDFPDGLSNTLFFVEAGEPVLWTKPEDIPYDPDGPLPELPGLFHDEFRACFADCSRRFISKDTSETTLRALITRNAHDKPDDDWDRTH